MKTARQIRQWLENQEWYELFLLQVWGSFSEDMVAIKRIISGNLGKNTISSGFDWWYSNEGPSYWIKIDRQFREWYEKESK